MDFTEKTLSTKRVYNGKVVFVDYDDIETSDGYKSFREVIRHPGGVVIVAQKDENTILMVRQYRYPLKTTSLELPAGKLEYNENPDDAAPRELEEETGYIAKCWKSLGYIYTTPGICDEKLYLYLAKDLTYTKPNPDEGEVLQSLEYNINDVFKMINSGEINDAKTICAIHRAYQVQ
ncbi:MAG: NUDIX hydrolase [Candidatus Gastranaerophilaceae bacterium]